MRSSASAPASAARRERLAGVVRPGAGDDRHVVDGVDDRLDHLDVFVVGHRRGLARRPGRDEAVDARGFESLGVTSECLEVDTAVLVVVERRTHRGVDAVEVQCCHC
jgi:hypothetical protein